MYQRVRDYVRRYEMIRQEDRVIVGVSGGADSICLLFMLIELRKEMDFSIVAVHVHHGLRGEAADEDAAYVEKICKEQGISCKTFYEDVREAAARDKLTLEEAGRNVRRDCFRKVLEEERGTKIALAHHQNDNAETLLWNLCRGCGLNGLGGIAPVDGVWLRPLLCLKRCEIEEYLERRRLAYCVDATNLEDDYTRNRIRQHVIPYLEEQVNSRAVSHMAETMEQMRMIGDYIREETLRYEKSCIRYEENGKAVVIAESFRQVPKVLQTSLLHSLLCRIAGRRKDIETVHIKLLEELLEKQVGRQIDLPYSVCARRCYEGIELFVRSRQMSRTLCGGLEEKKVGASDERNIGKPKENDSKEVRLSESCKIRWRLFRRPKDAEDTIIFPENPYTKWFDYDIIKCTVKIRHREPGDYITISRDGKTQKLKQYFINEKVPGGLRDGIWLAADGHHVMWIVGYRQSQKYQITDKTRRILEIEFYGGEENGGEYQSIGSRDGCCEAD